MGFKHRRNGAGQLLVNPTIEVELALKYRSSELGEASLPLDFDDPDDIEFARNLLRLAASGSPTAVDELDLDPESLEVAKEAGLLMARSEAPATMRTPSLSLDDYAPTGPTKGPTSGTEIGLAINRDVWSEHDWRARGHGHDTWYFRKVGDNPADILDLDDSTLYVRDPVSRFISVVNLRGQARTAWKRLTGGEIAPHQLPAALFRKFADASLLTAPDSDFAGCVEGHVAELHTAQFTVIRNAINPVYCAWLGAYALARMDSGWLTHERHRPTRRRWAVHNDPIMQTVHLGLSPLVRAITAQIDKPSRPSYAYLGVYGRGAVLERHTDRPQCRWNLSLLLGSRPYAPRDRQWPIYIESATGRHCVRLGPGDAVMYSGIDLPHWRDALKEVDLYAACFFHFVDEDFLGHTD